MTTLHRSPWWLWWLRRNRNALVAWWRDEPSPVPLYVLLRKRPQHEVLAALASGDLARLRDDAASARR